MRLLPLLPFLVLTGCFATEGWFEANVQDVDGDGVIATRFGGDDCDDTNAAIGDCDVDGDGFVAMVHGGDDCDDDAANVHPGAPEVCDGIDNDCDGFADNDDSDVVVDQLVYRDADGDGEGDAAFPEACQELVDGVPQYASNSDDCDDTNPEINHGKTETCGDGLDNDCDGGIDDVGLWYADGDGDGWGSGLSLVTSSCTLEPGSGEAALGGDCDDGDSAVNPGAEELPYDGVDQNCSGLCDEYDADGDLYVGSQYWTAAQGLVGACGLVVGDCDDSDDRRYVDNIEICDGVDNDCNERVDTEDLTSPGSAYVVLRGEVLDRYLDLDGDGFHGTLVQVCPQDEDPSIHHVDTDDCFDSGPVTSLYAGLQPAEVNPAAIELCDGADNDCDNQADWDDAPFAGSSMFYLDADHDTFGGEARHVCSQDTLLYLVSTPDDCDDDSPAVYPGAPEICGDLVRQDCDHLEILVNGVFEPTSPWDCDADGFEGLYNGNGTGDDCEDQRPDVNPSVAEEVCDGVDNDCNGLVDSDDDIEQTEFPLWYFDADGDGFGGEPASADTPPVASCGRPGPAYVLLAGDCQDDDPDTNPQTAWYEDVDLDGYGRVGAPVRSCRAPVGFVRATGDCDDTNPRYHPQTRWLLDGDGDFYGGEPSPLDPTYRQCLPPDLPGNWVPAFFGTDCDDVDPDVGALGTWYRDNDGDEFGVSDAISLSCERPPGYASIDGDCDDRPILGRDVSPQASEVCDGIDNDCDGAIDDDDGSLDADFGPIGYRDADGDGYGQRPFRFCIVLGAGYSAAGGDCDDDNPAVSPESPEVCANGIDDDCDGVVDQEPSWYVDNDGDRYGAGEVVAIQCSPPEGGTFATRSDDCDDSSALTFPRAPERDSCDGVDDDCDGTPEPRVAWYPDQDQDGYGSNDGVVNACASPPGDWSPQGGDCNDDDPNIILGPIWYLDEDGDTLGDSLTTRFACPPDDLSTPGLWLRVDVDDDGTFDIGDEQLTVDGGDCNDQDAAIGSKQLYFADVDGDDWGTLPAVLACPGADGGVPPGYSQRSGDCLSSNLLVFPDSLVNPGAVEVAGDGVDSNCDGFDDPAGACDENDPSGSGRFLHPDADGDGHGSYRVEFVASCTVPPGYSATADDCDDTNPNRFRGALERCNGLDDDCDGVVPVDERDLDGDGFLACADDCDDRAAGAFPGNPTSCNGVEDDDCDPTTPDLDRDVDGDGWSFCGFDPDDTDEHNVPGAQRWYRDDDGDRYGVDDHFVYSTIPVPGYSLLSGDCDDASNRAFPGFPLEFCDGIDNDCDGVYVDGDDGPNFDVSNPRNEPLFVEPSAYRFADLDGNGLSSVSSAFAGCGDIPDSGTIYLDGVPYGYVNADGVTAEFADCDDGTNQSGDLYWSDTDGDGVGSTEDGFGLRCPGDDPAPSGWVPVPVDAREDCQPYDSSRYHTLESGQYADEDGDGHWSLVSRAGRCVGPYVTDPLVSPDCDDTSSSLSLYASSTMDIRTQPELDNVLASCRGYVDLFVHGSMALNGPFRSLTDYRLRPGSASGACSQVPNDPGIGGCLTLGVPITVGSGAYVRFEGLPLGGHLDVVTSSQASIQIEESEAYDFSVRTEGVGLSFVSGTMELDATVEPSFEITGGSVNLDSVEIDSVVPQLAVVEDGGGFYADERVVVSGLQTGITVTDSTVSFGGELRAAPGVPGTVGLQITNGGAYRAPNGSGARLIGFDSGITFEGTNNWTNGVTIEEANTGVAVGSFSVGNVADSTMSRVGLGFRVDVGGGLDVNEASLGEGRLIQNHGSASFQQVTMATNEGVINEAGASLYFNGAVAFGTISGTQRNDGYLVFAGLTSAQLVTVPLAEGTGSTNQQGGSLTIQDATTVGGLFQQADLDLFDLTIARLRGPLAVTTSTLNLQTIDIADMDAVQLVSATGSQVYLGAVTATGNAGPIVVFDLQDALEIIGSRLESQTTSLDLRQVGSVYIGTTTLESTSGIGSSIRDVGGISINDSRLIGQNVLDVATAGGSLSIGGSTLWSDGGVVLRVLNTPVQIGASTLRGSGLDPTVLRHSGTGSMSIQSTLLHHADRPAQITCGGSASIQQSWVDDIPTAFGGCTVNTGSLIDASSGFVPSFTNFELNPPLSGCVGPSSTNWPCSF